ncbi:3-hydroxyacyl-CoA dehydrogenase family protein [Sphingopyxis kveilinensis]|uniref:3-hydroxyacyl-CoA dehydrogenase family protein n=1 Tax=Sphingopyxis kveilinensis TaxID=3114367 RepID=UPI003BB1D84A
MYIEDVKTIAVIGAGNMGHQIALHAAICGFKVSCTDISPDMLSKADAFVDRYLPERVAKGRLTAEQAQTVRANIGFTEDLGKAVGNADYVIEAVIEQIDAKRAIFAQLDALAPPHAILASNSSMIVASRFADATKRPDKVLNLHFFNPALVMKLVEVVQGPHASDATAHLSMQLCRKLGKEPVHVKKEVAGFLLNRIFKAILKEAEWLHEMGVASFEDIDKACVFGAGHPMGPFRLNDLTGLDLAYLMDMEAFRASGDPADLPRPALVARYAQGNYGEKSGKGWYNYS